MYRLVETRARMPTPIEHPAPAGSQKEKQMRSASVDTVSVEAMAPGAYLEITGTDAAGDVGQLILIKTVQDSIVETKRFCHVATASGGEEPREIDKRTGFALPELAHEYFYMVSDEYNGPVRVSPVLTKNSPFDIHSELLGLAGLFVTGIILHD